MISNLSSGENYQRVIFETMVFSYENLISNVTILLLQDKQQHANISIENWFCESEVK